MSHPYPLARREHARRSVSITMADGAELEGQLVVPVARAIGEVLNSSRTFFEFETREGKKIFLAKAAIRSIQVKDLPKLDQRARPTAGPAARSIAA